MKKILALLLFITLPIITFVFGINYQNIVDNFNSVLTQQKGCTLEAKICPDGSAVGRQLPNCEFAPCPTQIPKGNVGDEKFSGLIANIKYDCHFDGICNLTVNNKQIIIGQGEMANNPSKGLLVDISLDEDQKSNYIGKTVNVFAKKVNKNVYTIYGSDKYYVKLSDVNKQVFCGGIAGIKCPEGYICQLDGNYPDAAGTCIDKTSPVELYECPQGSYVDCMPGPDQLKKTECTPQYLQWAQENCPNFKGAAY